MASVPIPKFASVRRTICANFGIEKDTGKSTSLVPLLNPKFANPSAAKSCELRVRGTRRTTRSSVFAIGMSLATAVPGGPASAQAPPGNDWCRWCFVFQGQAQVGPSQFDLRFDNRCAVAISFNYWRQRGDNGEPKADDRFTEIIPPGEQTRRCVGSRTWRCTPVVTYRFACPPPLQRYPPPRW